MFLKKKESDERYLLVLLPLARDRVERTREMPNCGVNQYGASNVSADPLSKKRKKKQNVYASCFSSHARLISFPGAVVIIVVVCMLF